MSEVWVGVNRSDASFPHAQLTDLMHTLRSSGGMCVTVPLEWVLISVLPRMREKPKSAAGGGTNQCEQVSGKLGLN